MDCAEKLWDRESIVHFVIKSFVYRIYIMLLLEVRRLSIIPYTLPWLLLIGEGIRCQEFLAKTKYLTADVLPNTMQATKYADDFKVCRIDY